MSGKKTSVTTLFKLLNPRILYTHCHDHDHALNLAVKDAYSYYIFLFESFVEKYFLSLLDNSSQYLQHSSPSVAERQEITKFVVTGFFEKRSDE